MNQDLLKKSIKVLVIIPGIIPSVTIGILLPLIQLEKQGLIQLRIFYSGKFKIFNQLLINWCDVAIFCRNCEMHDLDVLYTLKQKQKKVIYEIDDNFFDIDLVTKIALYHKQFHRLYIIKKFFELSDITRVYSKSFYERALSLGAKAHYNNLYFSLEVIKDIPKPLKGRVIKIAYPTTRIDEPDLEHIFFNVLKNILEKYKDKVELHLWKKEVPEMLVNCSNIILHNEFLDYTKFLKKFYNLGIHIGLAPSLDTAFYHSKTNNKYREFGGCKIAGVYTNALPYLDCVVDRKNGLLVNNTLEEWESKISELIENEQLRENIAKNAFKDIQENYRFEDFIDVWKSDILGLMSLNPVSESKKRIKKPVNRVVYYKTQSDLNDFINYMLVSITRILGVNYSLMNKGDYGSAIFIATIENDNDLKLLQFINLGFAGVIIDCTKFNGSFEKFLEVIGVLDTSVSIIVDKCKNLDLDKFPSLQSKCFFVKSGTNDYFRVDGYHAAYFEALDTNFIFCKNTFSFKDIKYKYQNKFSSLKRFWILIKWQLGFRSF